MARYGAYIWDLRQENLNMTNETAFVSLPLANRVLEYYLQSLTENTF